MSPSDESPQLDPELLEGRGLRGRIAYLRDRAAGSRRPLGSPEGPGHAPNPNPTSSRVSSNPARLVDSLAIGIRQVSIWADWVAGRFLPDRDFVATAEESYNVAAPLAGHLLEHMPEEGPLVAVVEKSGLLGAGIAAGTWFARAFTGRPGGRAESDALADRFVRKIAKTKAGREAAQAEAMAETAAGAAPPNPPAYAGMVGLDDDEMGIGVPV